jgi:hypothetical protein
MEAVKSTRLKSTTITDHHNKTLSRGRKKKGKSKKVVGAEIFIAKGFSKE